MAADQPSSGTYGQLAYYLYASLRHLGRRPGGEARPRRRRRSRSASQVKQQLDQIRKQAVKAKKQQAKAQKNAPSPTTPGANPLQSPFGGTGTAP